MTRFPAHDVAQRHRADGSILLTSKLALGPVARTTNDWLDHWARARPDTVFLAERDGAGWRDMTYCEVRTAARAIAAGLLDRGLRPGQPIVVLSGPSVDHGLLMLAALMIGAPIAPLAEQYALLPEAHDRLTHCVSRLRPAMVFAAEGARFSGALSLPVFDGVQAILGDAPPGDDRSLAALRAGSPGPALDRAIAGVGPGTVGKILFTSGSTSSPKGVPQTHRMMCVNQAQYLAAMPVLGQKRHRLLDWLPWNHVFASNSNFNMMLANGGTFCIDHGKPVEGRFDTTLENQRMRAGSLSFNVPVAYARLVAAMRQDAELRRSFFRELDVLLYAGASLPGDVWSEIERMALEETGTTPLMTSSWGLTETAPSAIIYHQRGARSGMVGVPVPGLTAKLLPLEEARFELRVRGPNVFSGYLGEPEKTRQAFDEEGFFISGDAVRLVDAADVNKGVIFDGRLGEDFKLTTGTWVQGGTLRLTLLTELRGLVQDALVVGAGRDALGLLVFALPAQAGAPGQIVTDPAILDPIRDVLARQAQRATGSSNRITRALVMAEPPHAGDGEITAKGSLNSAVVLRRRADLLARLYDDDDPAVLRLWPAG